MAFPTIPTTGANTLLSSTTTTATTTHTFPSLTTLAPSAGDLLIAICVQYSGTSGGSPNDQFSSWGASFTETRDDETTTADALALGVAHKVATGSESGTFTVTSAGSFRSVNFLMRIPAATWHGTTIPEVAAAVRATGAAADPGSLDPSWDTEDTLWIAVYGHSETSTTGSPPTIDADPTNYSGELIVARAADAVGHITAGVSFRQSAAASEDAGTWTVSNPTRGNGLATTIAVRPAAAPQTINAGVASEADAALAATVSQPQAPVSGGVASEADSGPAATVSQPQVPVAGGVASEADSAPAATVDQGSGAFSPDDIAGLQGWWKADTIGLADGANVTTWEDSHTSNRDLTGATGQTHETNELNGLPVVRFDGVDDMMATSTFTWNQPVTLFVLCKFRSSYTAGQIGVLDSAGAAFRRYFYRASSTQMGLYGGMARLCGDV
jgi:hypothetical protein